MNRNVKRFWGFVLVIVGVLSVLNYYDIININLWELWPLVILALGLMFEVWYFISIKKEAGLLVPGGILITIASNFIICIMVRGPVKNLPGFAVRSAPGIGLLQMYLFGEKILGVLVASLVLLSIGGFFLLINMSIFINFGLGFAVVLILIGGFLIFGKEHNDSR